MGRMKSDLYTKVVLTVIAACLLGLVFRDQPVVPAAYAQGNETHMIIDNVQGALPVTIDSVQGGALPVRNPVDRSNKVVPLETEIVNSVKIQP